MSRTTATLAIVLISFLVCCCRPTIKSAVATANSADQHQSQLYKCGIEGFTLAIDEHIINEVEQPISVREIKGTILSATGQGWPQGHRVLFEIRELGQSLIKRPYVDENGNFSMKKISDGRYCFKATIIGWQSVIGVIIVDKKTDPKNKILIEMKLGV
jgi:hypothetical protein